MILFSFIGTSVDRYQSNSVTETTSRILNVIRLTCEPFHLIPILFFFRIYLRVIDVLYP